MFKILLRSSYQMIFSLCIVDIELPLFCSALIIFYVLLTQHCSTEIHFALYFDCRFWCADVRPAVIDAGGVVSGPRASFSSWPESSCLVYSRGHRLPYGGINDPDPGLIRINKASSWQVNICQRWIYLLYISEAAFLKSFFCLFCLFMYIKLTVWPLLCLNMFMVDIIKT